MSTGNPRSPEPRRASGRRKKALIAFVLCLSVLAALVVAGIHYRFHLLWLYQEQSQGLQGVRAIPHVVMPETGIPDGWTRHRAGQIELSMSPEFTASERRTPFGEPMYVFQHGSRAVMVSCDTDNSYFSGLLESASRLHPRRQRLTLPQLRLAAYQASAEDFRWSMTPEEARRLTFCIGASGMTCSVIS